MQTLGVQELETVLVGTVDNLVLDEHEFWRVFDLRATSVVCRIH